MNRLSTLAVAIAATIPLTATSQDMPLSQVLIDGEDWQVVSEGHGFTDGLCTDAEGNLYFTDVKGGTAIIKVDLEGKQTEFIKDVTGISGLQWGADGELYACMGRARQVNRFDADGKMETIAEEVRPNDLVVTHDGHVYFTMTPTQEIRHISPDGKMTVVDTGSLVRPNGITLSPDQGTLVVSDHGGKFSRAWRIEKSGSLSGGENYITLRCPTAEPEVARGDGAATDAHGRYYITSAEGLQMFDPTGRMGGVIAKPQDAFLVSACFAGKDHAYLHVACGDKVYRRKTKTHGALFFQEPKPAEKPPK